MHGDGGSRTRVQRLWHNSFYVRSPFFNFAWLMVMNGPQIHASLIDLFTRFSRRKNRMRILLRLNHPITTHRKRHGMMQSALRQLLRSYLVCQLLLTEYRL